MKRCEKQAAEQILIFWVALVDKTTRQNEIIRQGPSIAGNLLDFRGELPAASSFKPEVISKKAEKLRGLTITDDERRAGLALSLLAEPEFLLVAKWPAVRNTYNPRTGSTWRRSDVALELAGSIERYEAALTAVYSKLLAAWQRLGGGALGLYIKPALYKNTEKACENLRI